MNPEDPHTTYTKAEVIAASVQYFMERQGHDEESATLPASVFADKYALRDREGRFHELTPDDMHHRMAREFARIEAKYPYPLSEEEIYQYLKDFRRIVPQGSPMFGIGNPFAAVSVGNCSVLPSPKDTMSSIFDTARDMANLYKRRFGVGIDLSELRPDGAAVNNAATTSTGAWSFADLYSYVTRQVGQSGRRGALMLTMDVRHPDIEKFITMKADLTKVTGANASVRVTDDFMRAVENDEEFTLRWPVLTASKAEWQMLDLEEQRQTFQARAERTVKARDIFKLIAEQACATGEPGMLFWDTYRKYLPLDYYPGFETLSTNPCSELGLGANDSCRLISIYLPDFVRYEFNPDESYFDYDAFADTVRVAMRLSDDLVDIELERLAQLRELADTPDEVALYDRFIETCRNGRRTGLGLHGLGDTLARLCLRYDSDEANGETGLIYETLKVYAYAVSVDLAKERGAFPIFEWAREEACPFFREDFPSWLREAIQTHGRRNGAILTNAPTGSVSILSSNCSSGIEPVFANTYNRKRKVDAARDDITPDYVDATGDAWVTYPVFHSNIKRFQKLAMNDPARYFRNQYAASTFATPEDVPLPDYFVTAEEINWQARVALQATITRRLDHNCSSTINLPRETTPDVVEQIYLEAWKSGCKGITVYRDGSRDAQVLSTPTKEAGKLPAQKAETIDTDWVASAQRDAALLVEKNLRDRLADFDAQIREHPDCLRRTHRGTTTSGEMFKASFSNVNEGTERKVYVYIGTNEDNQPVEAFIIDRQGDEDLYPYADALAKMISLSLKYGVPCEEVERTLIGLRGGSTCMAKGIFTSVPDLVGKRLRAARIAWEEAGWDKTYALMMDPAVPGKESVGVSTSGTLIDATMRLSSATVKAPSGATCPNCQGHRVQRTGTCPTCLDCGWSKCS